jgi:small-conductance mechanosensitive channel
MGPAVAQNPAPQAPSPTLQPVQILDFLSHTVSWYRRSAVERQLAGEPEDLTFFQQNRGVAEQVIQLAFDYSRAQAELQPKTGRTAAPAQRSGLDQHQGLVQAAQKMDQQLQDTQKELVSTRAKLADARPAGRKLLESQVAELESEVGLLHARHDAIETMVEFVVSSSSGTGGVGLRAQIEELARSVPASLSLPAGTPEGKTTREPSPTSNEAVSSGPQPSGIWGLSADLFRLSGKERTLSGEIAATGELSQGCKNLRQPLVAYLHSLVTQGDQLFASADVAPAGQLAQATQQIDALTAQFKQVSAGLLPLSKIVVLLDIYQKTLANWRDQVKTESHEELRQLLLRIGVLVLLVAVVAGLGEIWRRTTFRYIHDARRRYQFLLLRRVVMWIAIILIIVLTFATQLGSVVTFAGLITAGVAVALQNVIISVFAYFILIGKYGIRVGDRVQIAGVTGEVVDIGLVRIHVMELGGPGDSQPTGRVVAFSNSIVFQPTAGLFKQIPGTNFVWHDLRLTLAPDSDYHTARERITEAVDAALADCRDSMEAQRRSMEMSLTTVTPTEFRPKVRLRYTASGIEAVVRFPVGLDKAGEIDDHLMRAVLAALDREPKLKLVSAEMPLSKAEV